MKYKILNNYLKQPLLVLDSFSPERKTIFHKVKDKDGNTFCKIDLWNGGMYVQGEKELSNNIKELTELRKILRLKPDRWPDGYVEYRLIYKDKFGKHKRTPNFAKCVCKEKKCEIVVCFDAGEQHQQGGPFQCYVFAELIRELDDEE